ncbi:hypothetical protein [Streptomyces goshikiensis]|uniref:hypothetical protein n=1 Tax=Streptomyces goshikiensis TaxID=1942 RepID=UPI00364940F4
MLHALAEHVAHTGPDTFGGWFWNRLRLPEPDRLDLLRRLLPADHRYLDAAARRLVRAPRFVQPLLCAWFTDERRLRGRPGATVATVAQALLHTHRRLAVDDLTEVLVAAAHPRADELLAVLAEEEPSALCRAVDRWARDERPGRRVAAAAYGPATGPYVRTPGDRELLRRAAQMLLRDPRVRARYLPDALVCFRDPECGSRPPAAALVAALPVLPDPDAVFDALRALAALSTLALARRAGDLVRDHLADRPEDAAHAAAFVDRPGPRAGGSAPRTGPAAVRPGGGTGRAGRGGASRPTYCSWRRPIRGCRTPCGWPGARRPAHASCCAAPGGGPAVFEHRPVPTRPSAHRGDARQGRLGCDLSRNLTGSGREPDADAGRRAPAWQS